MSSRLESMTIRFYQFLLAPLAAAVFVFLACPVLAGPGPMDQAISSYKARQYSQAISQFDAYSRTPGADQTSAHYYMALCFQCLNQVGRAQSEYQWVLSNGRDQTLRSYAQTALSQLGNYSEHRSYQGHGNPGQGRNLAMSGRGSSGGHSHTSGATSGSAGSRGQPRGKPKVLDFTASWCGWCKKMAPIVDANEAKFRGRVDFEKIDADDPTNAELKSKYQVSGLPCFVFLDSQGGVVNKIPGATGEDEFENAVQQLVGR